MINIAGRRAEEGLAAAVTTAEAAFDSLQDAGVAVIERAMSLIPGKTSK